MRRACIALLLWSLISGCSSEVAGGLDESQSQEALAVLSSAGIAADRALSNEGKEPTYKIQVPSADAGRAAAVLRAFGLPRQPQQGFGELYKNASMIPTATEEKARFLDALAGEIAGHLQRLDGVVEASVIVTAPQEDPLAPPDKARPDPTASVLLKIRPDVKLPADDDVKRLVAGAVEGMKPDGVAIVSVAAAKIDTRAPVFDRVGPIRVARSSKTALLGTLGGALGLVIVMALWIIRRERKRATERGQPGVSR